MKLIDLHCDTLYKSVTENKYLDDEKMENSLSSNDNKVQCYAIWCPDELTGIQAENLFLSAYKKLKSECNRLNLNYINNFKNIKNDFQSHKNNIIFTLENAIAFNKKLENVAKFAQLGLKMVTLTWNDSNFIGDGAMVETPKGLTELGKKFISELEKNQIIIDISHASDNLFYDVERFAKRPFIASHSNSRSVCNHKRNLTDEQFNIIKSHHGIIGLNFHKDFLSDTPNKASAFDILRHTEYFMSLGAEDTLSIGSDFDGCTLPDNIKGSSSIDYLYELFLKHNYKENLVNKIFYENALNFFENFDNHQIL